MQNFADQLSSNPQAKQLLENQKAIRQMLANPETRKVLQSLQKKNVGRLQAAAQSALPGGYHCPEQRSAGALVRPPSRQGHGAAEQNLKQVIRLVRLKGGDSPWPTLKKHSTLCWQTLTPWDRSCPWPESWGWGRSPLLPPGKRPPAGIRRPAPLRPRAVGADGPPAGAVPGQPPVQPGGRRPDRRAPALPAGGAPEKAGPSHPTGRAVSGSPAGLPPMERG